MPSSLLQSDGGAFIHMTMVGTFTILVQRKFDKNTPSYFSQISHSAKGYSDNFLLCFKK